MDENLHELISIMWDQVKVLNLFKELGEAKTPALVKGKYEELERIIKAEELLIVELGHLERQRQERNQTIAHSLGVAAEELSVTGLKETFVDCTEELDKIKEQFAVASNELGELNQLNNELIEQSLRHLDFTLRLLTEVQENPSYNPNGGDRVMNPPETSRFFDRWV